MTSVAAQRLIMAAVTLLGVAIIVFVLLRVVPGDPIAMMISPGATPADIAALRAHYGLDTSLPTQFFVWLRGHTARRFRHVHFPSSQCARDYGRTIACDS